jgi:hypothetical protein
MGFPRRLHNRHAARQKIKFFYDDVMQGLSLAPPFFFSFFFLEPSV